MFTSDPPVMRMAQMDRERPFPNKNEELVHDAREFESSDSQYFRQCECHRFNICAIILGEIAARLMT
jgi:hypothetical protein